MTHDPICKRADMHAYACTYVCTHALGPRQKILGAICISAQEQNFGSNAISHSQFCDAISLLQFADAISAMQFHFCRRQCNFDIPALARLQEILGAIPQKLFQKGDAISQFPEAIAISTFQKCNAIFNHMESSWEAEARSTFHYQLLEAGDTPDFPAAIFYRSL